MQKIFILIEIHFQQRLLLGFISKSAMILDGNALIMNYVNSNTLS